MSIISNLLKRNSTSGYTLTEEQAVSTAVAVKKSSKNRGIRKLLASVLIVASLIGIGGGLATIEEQTPVSVAQAEECEWWNLLCHGDNVLGAIGGGMEWVGTKVTEGFEWVGGVITQSIVAGINMLLVSWLCENNVYNISHLPATIPIGSSEQIISALGGATTSSGSALTKFHYLPQGQMSSVADLYTASGGTGVPLDWSLAFKNSQITGEGKYLTGYEKYGIVSPMYEVWSPAYASYQETAIAYLPMGNYKHSSADNRSLTYTPSEFIYVKPLEGNFMTTNPFDCININGIGASLLNALTIFPRLGMLIAIETYGMAIAGSASSSEGFTIFGWMSGIIEDLVTKPGGLRDAIFFPFLLPMILLGSIYLAWIGLIKRQTSKAISSVVWMISGTSIAVFTMMSPMTIPVLSDYLVSNISLAFSSAVNSSTPASALCELPEEYEADTGNTSYDRYILETKCLIWKVSIYDTWVTGQFGAVDTNAHLNASAKITRVDGTTGILKPGDAPIYLGSHNKVDPSRVDWGMVHLDRQVVLQKTGMTDIAYTQLSGSGVIPATAPRAGEASSGPADYIVRPDTPVTPIENVNWGWASWDTVSSALMMIMYALPMMFILIYFAFLMLVYQLSLLGLMLTGPILFVIAVLPSFGMGVASKYFAELLGLTIKRIMTAVTLSLYLFFLSHATAAVIGGSLHVLLTGLVVLLITGMILGLRTQLIKSTMPTSKIGGGISFNGAGGRTVQAKSPVENLLKTGGSALAGYGLNKFTQGRKTSTNADTREETPPNPLENQVAGNEQPTNDNTKRGGNNIPEQAPPPPLLPPVNQQPQQTPNQQPPLDQQRLPNPLQQNQPKGNQPPTPPNPTPPNPNNGRNSGDNETPPRPW